MNANEQPPWDIYERTFEYATQIVRFCRELDTEAGISRRLASQLFDAGTSIGANLEEGRSAQSRADFIHKYSIALKEARETMYWLKLVGKSEMAPHNQIDNLMRECNELIAILTTIIKKTKEK